MAPLRRAISCLTTAQLYVSKPGDPRALALSEDPLRVRPIGSGDFLLSLRQQFRSVKDPMASAAQRWHVSTVRYDYRLSRANDGSELVSWHWHPGTHVQFPHLHTAASGEISRRVHLPSGRVSIESVLRLLLGDLGVPAKRDDWAQVLDEAEGPFIKYRRWSG